MQAREGAQVAVVLAGVQLVVVGAGVSLVVVPPEHQRGQRWWCRRGGSTAGSSGGSAAGGGRSGASGGSGVKARGVGGCMSSSSSSDPSSVKNPLRSSAAIYMYVTETESMIKFFFYLILFSSKFTRESTYLIIPE